MIPIIIPDAGNLPYLIPCLRSILEKTTYKDYQIVLVDNAPDDTLEKIVSQLPIKHLKYPKKFVYSEANNWAIDQLDCEQFVLMHSDVEVISPYWLEGLLICMKDKVGVVGCKLLFPDGRIQHEGVIPLPIPQHRFYGKENILERNIEEIEAVTFACALIRKSVYNEVGKIELEDYFSDIDFCLKVRKAGYKIIYNPKVVLIHHENASLCKSFKVISR